MAVDLTQYTAVKMSALIDEARGILSDRGSNKHVADSDLLYYANDALRLACVAKPELFITTQAFSCATGARQSMPAQYNGGVTGVKGITRTTRDVLDRVAPGWMTSTPGTAVNWAPHESDRFSFYLYPPSYNGQSVEVSFIQVPRPYASDEAFPLPHAYLPAVVDYVVGMSESRDDPHVMTGRAAQFMAKFTNVIAPQVAANG